MINNNPDTSPQLHEATENLPLTMSQPLSRALTSLNNYRYKDALIHFLDFFEMSVQWLNCYMLGLACTINGGGELKGVAAAVREIDAKRPLSFGDCVNEIFNPLLKALKNALPGHPLLESLTENVKNRKIDILVGSAKVPGVIKIRNDYKGHSTSLSEDIYRGVLDIIMPKVEAMVKGVGPLSGAKIYTVDTEGTIIDLHGGWHKDPLRRETQSEISHYYVGFEGFSIIDLYPLVLGEQDKYVYLFQTLKAESVKYESSDENVHGFETEKFNREFDAFLQRLNPAFDIAKESNWIELCNQMRRHSTAFMVQVQKEKKYSSELFVDRSRLSSLLRRFDASPATILPLSGDAGQGKTNQMCNWTERMLDADEPVMIFNSASFADYNLDNTLKDIFGASLRRPLKRVLDHLHDKARENDKNVFFFFDAVNECLHYNASADLPPADTDAGSAPLALYQDIVGNLVKEEYPRFKIVTTCRSYTWKNQILPNIDLPASLTYSDEDDTSGYVVGFTDEEAHTAYAKYEELYQMTTPFDELDRRIMLRLRDPLVMKFVCSNYVGTVLSADPHDYTSINLFSKMLSDIRDHSFAGRKQCRLLEELSRLFLRSYLQGQPLGSITNSDLRDAYNSGDNPLQSLSRLIYKKDGITVAYTELRNKPDRPILREVEKSIGGVKVRSVEFIYERFLEYMMARVFLEDAIKEGATVDAGTFVSALSGAAINVVFIGTMRNAVIMEIIRTGDFKIIFDLIAGYNDRPEIMQLVSDVLDVMIRENYEERLFSLIDGMLDIKPDDPGLIQRFNLVKQ